MQRTSGWIRASFAATIALVGLGAAVIFAQQRSETSQSSGTATATRGGQATATASASGRASASGGQQGLSRGSGSAVGHTGPLYAVWFSVVTQRGQLADWIERHNKYTDSLLADGRLLTDGPFRDGSGYLWLLKAADDRSAENIVKNDPAVQNGNLQPTVKLWDARFAPPASLGLSRAGGR